MPAGLILFLCLRAPSFLQEADATGTDVVGFVSRGILEIIFLVIFFRRIEWLCRQNLSHDRWENF